MTAKVLLNPYSNRWNSHKALAPGGSRAQSRGRRFRTGCVGEKGTSYRAGGEAARDGFSPIIAAGGDGSIGDVANGLARAAKSEDEALGPLGIMPLGSANDLVYALGLPTDLNEAAKVIAAGKTKPMDLGNSTTNISSTIRGRGSSRTPPRSTSASIGSRAWRVISWRRSGRSWTSPNGAGRSNGTTAPTRGRFRLVSIGNGRRTGGFFMTPHADPFDGKLTLAFGYRATRLGLFTALPKAFNEDKGSYVELDGHERSPCDTHIHPLRQTLPRAHRRRNIPRMDSGFRVRNIPQTIEHVNALR
jgi:diacylglycerol kinase (ATP)